ncbi:MAG: carbamoyltransferase HypF [Clostridia bacterium]|nr:carbamoyltransferase HypF [Clostridia bacterium]
MQAEKTRSIINIKGIVQGVGFRPFVYNLAALYHITGWVMNFPGGVCIEAEGGDTALEAFQQDLLKKAPPLSYIDRFAVETAEPVGYQEFVIKESKNEAVHDVYISPDVAVCEDCLRELKDPGDRRFGYPFINCTNCGPRFTITTGIPYDRNKTTMAPFAMCGDCAREYHDPMNRRFHAQPVACPKCGPALVLMDSNGNQLAVGKEMEAVWQLLRDGKIVAIKGLGGYHLACDAENDSAVKELRKRKIRDGKPFALMARDIETVSKYCRLNDLEKRLLLSWKRPVVLLQRNEESSLPLDSISSDNQMLGMMLPYTPLHHLLFEQSLDILVMTSGNKSGEPIYYKDDEAFSGLKGVADCFLMNDREIFIRTDDSVTSVFRDKEYIVRRSRGYVPFPLDISGIGSEKMKSMGENIKSSGEFPGILACGGELKNTFCIVKNGRAFMSHHIGDLENLETLKSFEDGIAHFQNIFTVKPEIVVHDAHPEYLSTKYARNLEEVTLISVQHHRAHVAACMAENGVDQPVIGIAFDGTGYGDDGCIWGGEFFTGDYSGFNREAALRYIPLPGGELSIKEPWRMAFSYLYQCFGDAALETPVDFIKAIGPLKLQMVKHQIDRSINSPLTSSMGRLFDAVSALLGLCSVITYEGEAAIKLEKVCDLNSALWYPCEIRELESGLLEINTGDIIKAVITDILNRADVSSISGRFHRTVVNIIIEVCKKLREKRGINAAALSGGVFQNRVLLEWAVDALEKEGFTVYTHSNVPANDGGLALGQAAIGWRMWLDQTKG